MPVIDLSERQLEELANAAVNRGLTGFLRKWRTNH